MPWKVLYSSLIQQDYEDAYDWYEDQQEGLGIRFLEAVRIKISAIESNPELFGSRVNKRDWTIYVTSIHHTKKHPRKKYRK